MTVARPANGRARSFFCRSGRAGPSHQRGTRAVRAPHRQQSVGACARSGNKARYESFLRGAGLAPAAAPRQGCRRCGCRCGSNPVCCAEGCRNSLSQHGAGADHQQLTGGDAKVGATHSLLQQSLDNRSQLRQDAPDRAVKQSPTLTTCETSCQCRAQPPPPAARSNPRGAGGLVRYTHEPPWLSIHPSPFQASPPCAHA